MKTDTLTHILYKSNKISYHNIHIRLQKLKSEINAIKV